MKTKYERMKKDEKIKVNKSFKKDNYELYKKFKIRFLICYIGIIFSFIGFFYDLMINSSIFNIIFDIVIFIISILYLFKIISIKKDTLNNYVLKNKRF